MTLSVFITNYNGYILAFDSYILAQDVKQVSLYSIPFSHVFFDLFTVRHQRQRQFRNIFRIDLIPVFFFQIQLHQCTMISDCLCFCPLRLCVIKMFVDAFHHKAQCISAFFVVNRCDSDFICKHIAG